MVSLELEGALRDCILDSDSTPLFYAARALLKLQLRVGLIPRIQVRCCLAASSCSRHVSQAGPAGAPC